MVLFLSKEKISVLFHIICAIAAISLSIYWIYTYFLNKDLCTVDYKTYYDDPGDQYPVLSMCFENFLSEEKLAHHQISWNDYSYFLKGNYFEEHFLQINYHDVMENISKYLEAESFYYRNGTHKQIRSIQRNVVEESFVGIWYNYLYNCYSLITPHDKELEVYEIILNSTVFPNSSRVTVGGMLTLIHFRNQLTTSSETLMYSWPKRKKYEDFAMKFKILGVEVIKRRRNGRKPCYVDWKNYDDFVQLEHLKNTGCRAPYLRSNKQFPLCKSKETIKNSQWNLKRSTSNVRPPCNAMEKVYFSYEEEDYSPSIKQSGLFRVSVWFSDQQFKEIAQER